MICHGKAGDTKTKRKNKRWVFVNLKSRDRVQPRATPGDAGWVAFFTPGKLLPNRPKSGSPSVGHRSRVAIRVIPAGRGEDVARAFHPGRLEGERAARARAVHSAVEETAAVWSSLVFGFNLGIGDDPVVKWVRET